MQPLSPQVLTREVELLAHDLARLLPDLRAQVRGIPSAKLDQVLLVGSGDSFFAAMSTAMAFRELAGLPCKATPSFEFIAYTDVGGPHCLVVVASASGNTARAVQALAHAREAGARTLAVTTNPHGALCELADWTLIADLPEKEPCPGVRSFQATLLATLVLVLELGASRGRAVEPLVGELAGLAPAIDHTAAALRKPLREIADHIAHAPVWVVAGSGPNRGTAHYAAAKFVESLGRLATGTDIDEWWHIERHLVPHDLPLFLIAPPGPARERALQLAEVAKGLGWHVYVVADAEDSSFAQHAERVLPIRGTPREIFSPLLYHLFAPALAGLVAECTNTRLFPARGR